VTDYVLDVREAAAEAARFWWVFLLTGIAWILASLVIFRFDYTSVSALSYLFGAVAILFGVNELMAIGGSTRGWRIWHGLLGVLFVIVGVIALLHPYDTFQSLAALMSFFLVFAGVFDIVVALATKNEIDFWWVTLITGIVQVLLGFWAAGYFGRSAFLLVVWVAATCLARGISQIVFAFKMHGLRKELVAG
jgi:uncharacterized membrane protein HdeD (DUF308 family)